MQEQDKIIRCYDITAIDYAEKFSEELKGKHLDQILLTAFVNENKASGKLIDLGCGPGQTTKFIYETGFTNILGADISTEMVKVAKDRNPRINFEQADLLNLKYSQNSFGSAIAFYAIVHFNYNQIRQAFKEVKRILIKNGQFLFSFHIGTEVIKLDKFLNHDVAIEFYFFEIDKIKRLLIEVNFEILDIIQRHPYTEEHQSNRAYIWARKV